MSKETAPSNEENFEVSGGEAQLSDEDLEEAAGGCYAAPGPIRMQPQPIRITPVVPDISEMGASDRGNEMSGN